MSVHKPSDLTPRERVWQVVWWLASGQKLSYEDVRRHTRLSERGVRSLMLRMSRVLPLYRHRAKWQAMQEVNEEDLDDL